MTLKRASTEGAESLAALIQMKGSDGLTLEEELPSMGGVTPDTVLTVTIDLTDQEGYGMRLTRRLKGGIDWEGLLEWAGEVQPEREGCLWQSITIAISHRANRE